MENSTTARRTNFNLRFDKWTGFNGSSAANGSLPIGNGSGFTNATITGTSNQLTVTNGSGTITLSTPQNTNTAATFQVATIGLGVAADAAIPIFETQSTATTNAMVTQTQSSMTCSGTPAASFGQRTLYRLDDNTTANQNAAYIGIDWQAAAHASHNARYNLLLSTGGAAPASVFTITGDGIFNMALSGSNLEINGTSVLTSSTLGSGVTASSLTSVGTITTGTWNGTTIAVANGGTSNTTFTAYSVLCAGITATGAFQNVSGLGSSGNVLTSNGAGALPTWQAASGGGYSYSTITADQTGAVGNFYFTNKASRCVVTLPSSATIGQKIALQGDHATANGWKLAQPATTIIYWAGQATTAGTGGYLQSTTGQDMIEVTYQKNDGTNNVWYVTAAQGQIQPN